MNADDVAAAVAAGLGASELVFLSDVPGVLDAAGPADPLDRRVAPAGRRPGRDAAEARGLRDRGRAGVGLVRIGACGTVVTA